MIIVPKINAISPQSWIMKNKPVSVKSSSSDNTVPSYDDVTFVPDGSDTTESSVHSERSGSLNL